MLVMMSSPPKQISQVVYIYGDFGEFPYYPIIALEFSIIALEFSICVRISTLYLTSSSSSFVVFVKSLNPNARI